MRLIADDPIIRAMERTGYPPWLQGHYFPGCDAYYPCEEENEDCEEEEDEDEEREDDY